MDRRTIVAIILILLITLLMPYYQKLIMGDKVPPQKAVPSDSLTREKARDTSEVKKAVQPSPSSASEQKIPQESTIAATAPEEMIKEIEESSQVKRLFVENELIKAVFSTENGGNPLHWELKNYDSYLGGQVDLAYQNGLDVEITNRDGKTIKLSDFNLYANFEDQQVIRLDQNKPILEIEFYLTIENGKIVKKVILDFKSYSMDVRIFFQGLDDYVINRRYFLNWFGGLPSTEENIRDDYSYSRAYAYMAGELEDLDVSKEKAERKELNGRVDWAAIRTKYFLAAIIPHRPESTNGITLEGLGTKFGEEIHKIYSLSLEVPFDPFKTEADSFEVFLGPLDYGILKKYKVGLQTLVMSKDWYERLFRPISLLILPAFKFLHRFIPNYGLVILVFSVLIKLLLYPLTKKSYQSMHQMQTVQPLMAELREKYKNDPQRLNKEMMRLYKEHGINPLGGCLPMLLQMPLLFALFIVFRSTIQLRGQPFVLWITDLSRPDTLSLGFHVPFLGDSIHVLPIMMALTMIWQSKMTVTDPKQKFMIYFMPIFMVFIFYSLPSGLNLYYSVFNVLSMLQTRMIKKDMHPVEKEKPDISRAPKKAALPRQVSTKKKKSGRK